MDKQDIIRKMQEAGLKAPARGEFIFIHWDQIALLLEHERAAERETCAKVCETAVWSKDVKWWMEVTKTQVSAEAGRQCADAIRARSNA